MKRIFSLILFCNIVLGLCAEVEKETYVFDITESGDTLRLDRYVAQKNTDTPHPAVIFLFGGSFREGNRDAYDYIQYFEFLATQGFDAISIDYRTAMANHDFSTGAVGFAYSLNNAINIAACDLFSATNFVLENSDKWHIDPKQIMVSGSSAGAITVLQAENMISNRAELAKTLPSDFNYAGLISFAGAVCSSGEPKWDAERLCPMMMFHGDVDTTVPFRSIELMGWGMYGSEYISRQLDKLAASYELYVINREDHSVAVTPMKHNLYDILAFIEEYVINGEKRATVVNQSSPGASKDYNTSFSLMDYFNSNIPK